ncbi:TPA: ead/Ea22-like family protein [Citrobacter farmeri]
MSNIDKRALREAAARTGGVKWQYMRATQHSKAYITDDKGSTVVNCTDGDVPAKCAGFLESANPATVLALLDELEAKDKRIAELSRHLQCAHAFVEHTEAFGHAASNGILCCGDAQWNIDESKSALAAAGKGE